jgi:hypothetical protein
MKLRDFIADDKTEKVSTTKVWMHVANVVMSWVMLRQETVDWELLAAYGAIVGANYTAGLFLKLKYRDRGNDFPDHHDCPER